MPSRPFGKAALKRAVKRMAWTVGAMIRPTTPRSLILTYHGIGHRRHEMTVTTEAFAAQMRWLATQEKVIPLDAAVRGDAGVAITFDDGFCDNLHNAAPVLRALGLPATVFIVADRVGGTLDDEADPARGRLMDWDEIRALAAMGVDLGAHTLTHHRLARRSPAEQDKEIRGCKERMEAELGHPIRFLAYPYGAATDYDATSMALAESAGFEAALSNRYGPNRPGADRWQLRRIWIDGSDDMAFFRAKVTGQLDLLRHLEGRAALALRRVLNRLG